MSPIRPWLVEACLRIYPRWWRERYGDEVRQLAVDDGGGIGDLADIALGGLRQRVHQTRGGDSMTPRSNRWLAGIAAIVALAAAAPTALFIGINLLGVPVGALSAVRLPGGVSFSDAVPVLPGLSVLALVIALAPALRIGLRRDPADGVATVTLRLLAMPRWLVAVAFACGVIVTAVVAYGVSENLLELLR